MINVGGQRLALDSYAQGPSGAGSWMELVDRHLPDPLTPPGPLSGTLPPFADVEDPWAQNDRPLFEFDPSNTIDPDTPNLWDDECDCGASPPPVFDLPPPPPPPIEEEDVIDEEEESLEILYMGGKPTASDEEVLKSKEREVPHEIKWGVSPTKNNPTNKEENCEETPPSPQDACPALLIAGDAHVRPRLHPPIAALLVAAATFAFVIGIAAVVCWRFRKQRNRPGSTKSTTDLTNGVIYDDLPSGPTPRSLTAHGHDTCTLAPMELLDLKLTSHLHNPSSFIDQERASRHTILPSNTTVRLTAKTRGGCGSGYNPNAPNSVSNSFQHCASAPYGLGASGSPTNRTLRKDFSFRSRSPPPPDTSHNAEFYCHQQSSCGVQDWRFSPEKFKDFVRASYAELPGKKVPVKSSQELYNPTYEEISTGSDSTSVSSGSSNKKRSVPHSPRSMISPTGELPESWSPTPCPCAVKGYISSRRDSRARKQKATPNSVSVNSFVVPEYPEEPSTIIYGVMPPIPPPTLYTIPGTSDGRTSTSSSSDQPPERGREARYYVGGQRPPSIRSPGTPPQEGYVISSSTPSGPPLSIQDGLPPLPSRSDRYRIFFTTDRKRGGHSAPKQGFVTGADSKTLDLASRKRNRTKDFSVTTESEPLYHEL